MLNKSPQISDNLQWDIENGLVNIKLENKGLLDFILQKTMKKPKSSIIHLDEVGSFIWQLIDKRKTIEEIGKELYSKYENKVSPLYERLIKYIKILSEYKFIILK